MLRSLPFCLLVALVLCGCAGTRTFRPDDGDFARRHLEGRTATVALRDGRAFRAHALRVRADSVVWADPATLRFHSIALGDVARITVRSPRLTVSRSAASGALVGAAAGALLGAAAGYESGGCIIFCPSSPTSEERIQGALLFGAILGLEGAGAGALYGTLGGALFPAEWDLVPVAPDTVRTSPSLR